MRSWPVGPAPRWALRAAVVAGVVLATPAPALADDTAVEIHGYQYHAPDVTIEAGDSVTWTNGESARHDVATTAGPEAFQSPELAEGERFTYTFTQAGGYAYLCTLHPDMVGTLTVTPAPVTTSPPTTVAPAEAGGAPPTTSAIDAAAPTTTAAVAGGEQVAAPVAVASTTDLSDASRPYLEILAAVAAVVAAVGLLFGSQRRRRAPSS